LESLGGLLALGDLENVETDGLGKRTALADSDEITTKQKRKHKSSVKPGCNMSLVGRYLTNYSNIQFIQGIPG
jgi:hypothetical protein